MENPTETPVLLESDEHQSPSNKKTSRRFVGKNKHKKLVENVEFQPRKPHTRDTNKLRLNSKVVLDPSLKGSVIILDETSPKPTHKKGVNKEKSTRSKRIKNEEQSKLNLLAKVV